ncbi:hypothetical protein BDP27DRAFT_1312076 [Rhodocollybia butyracea]|uniref:Uncharacterized protein n=1 Tax=Rhodocollybia butyracea TaxID=206335 RepID=A0A9P5QAB2_9AGAR|nr:hypothetical protein BDP27DRAFT_1312076 [Rhodocollybia butyracea]
MSWTALLLTLNSLAQSGRQYRCSPGNFHQCQCRDVILQMKLAGSFFLTYQNYVGEEVYDTNLNQGVYRLKNLDCGFHAGCLSSS